MSAGLAQALAGHRPIEVSFEAYKREQPRSARKRLYPLTVFYTTYSLDITCTITAHAGWKRGMGSPPGFGTSYSTSTRNTPDRFAIHYLDATPTVVASRK